MQKPLPQTSAQPKAHVALYPGAPMPKDRKEKMRYAVKRTDYSALQVSMPLWAAFMVDHYHVVLSKNHDHLLPCPDFIDHSVFYGQGADVFCPPTYSMLFGQALCVKAHEVVNAFSEKKGQSFRENWRGIRAGVTMGLFGVIEAGQSILGHKPFDVPDMIAYTTGLAAFLHKKDIAREAKESFPVLCHQTEKLVRKTFGFREDRLT